MFYFLPCFTCISDKEFILKNFVSKQLKDELISKVLCRTRDHIIAMDTMNLPLPSLSYPSQPSVRGN